MPVFTSSIEVTADYPTIKPSLNLNFARARALDPRITFTRASVGTYVGRDGLVKTAGENEARFDHDPETLESLGLLTEESRDNNALYSDDFNNGAWVKQTGHGLTSNTTLAPDGTQNADTFNRGASNQYIYQSIGVTGTHTMSVWVKTPSGDGNHNFVMQHFNSTDGGLGATTFTATEEWQRFSIQASPTVTGGWYPCIPSTLGQDMHVWGAQLEAGSFATSYIPTSGSTVTRAADTAKITGTNFTDFYNNQESTIVCNFTQNAPTSSSASGNERLYSFRKDSGADTRIDYVSYNDYHPYIAADGSAVANLSGFAHLYGGLENKTAVRVKENDFAVSFNGTIESTDSSGTWPPTTNNIIELFIGSQTTNTSNLNGHIKQFSYYTKALPNTQLQLLTS